MRHLPGIDEMVVAMAREIRNDSILIVGAGSLLPAVALAYAKARSAPDAWAITATGGFTNELPLPLTVDFATVAAATYGSTWFSLADVAGMETFLERRTLEFVRPAQVDGEGHVNNSWVGSDRRIRLPGGAGIANVLLRSQSQLYVPRHDDRTLRERVDYITASAETKRRATRLYTPRAIFAIGNRGCSLVAVPPEESLDALRESTPFAFNAPERVERVALSDADRDRLGGVDPLGLRFLEALPTRERLAKLVALGAERS